MPLALQKMTIQYRKNPKVDEKLPKFGLSSNFDRDFRGLAFVLGFSRCAQRFFRGPNMLKIGSNIFFQKNLIFFSHFEKKCYLNWGRNQVLVSAFSKLTLKDYDTEYNDV